MALILAVNNGAFATLGFIGVNSPSGTASAASGVVFVDYAQCSNDAPPSTALNCPGGWINGILNTNNSHYHEGDVTPQRAEVSYPAGAAITGSTLTFRYETKKGGINAYDSLATWNYTQTAADRNQGLLAADIATAPLSTLQMLSDPTAAAHELPAANRMWTMYGGTLTSTTVPSHDCTTLATPCAGDDYATVTVTYNVPASAAGSSSVRNVQLLFGGHLAVSVGPLGWGPGLGSASVSGGPYHIKWDLADGASIGNRDNQIMSGAVIATPALSISKSGPATATLGVPFSYTLTVSNTGTGAQTGVSVSDAVPTGLTINGTPTSTLGTCSVSSQVVTCNLGTVNAGATATITINVTPTLAACGTVNNHGTLTPGPLDSNTVTTTINCPNVSILKTGSAAVSAGGTATFTVVVTAGGTGDSTSVTVSDTLPSGTWTLGGANAASCSITAGVLSCNFGTMTNGSTRTVTLSRATTAGDCPSISNTATVSAAVDASTANNSSTASITVNCGNIGLTKTADAATVTAGSPIGYLITATNSGAGTATAVTVTDTLPTNAGLSWSIDAAGSTAGCTITTGVLTCNFGDLAAGASAHVHLTSPTTLATCGTVSNSAHVATGNDGSANAGPTTITVNCPDVSVLKTAGAAVSAGSTVTFTITVTAGGTGDSTQVMLTDALASGHTWSVGGADAGSCAITPGLLSCDFGTMTNGSTRTITLSTTSTSADCPEGLTNTALLSAAVDANLDNDTSTANQTVNCGAISLAKTADNATVAAGQAIGFLITATNNGAGTATSATVSDTLPTTAGTSWSIDAAGSDTGCSITSGTLTCNFGDLASKASKHVHVTSPTTFASCGTVNNTATVRTGNDGTSEASASLTVTCPPPPALGGVLVTKYNDLNRNGARDAGEPGLQGFVFTVKSGATTVATLTTDANGTAASVNLTAGSYTVTETQQAGWTSTDPAGSLSKTVTVNAGQTTTVLFGNATVQLPPTSAGTLTVTKYNDLNGNKTRDTNEPALSGWTFTVKDASGATVGTAATDASGNATFQNLSFGTYTVTETLQTGWTSTDPGGTTPTKTVTISGASTTVLFGNAQIKLPNTSTLETPPASPPSAMLFLVAVLLGQLLLITLVFRRWRND